MSEKKFVIIDGNAIIHRAYHALPPLTAKGTMVNAVYGFTTMLLKTINDLKPDYLAVSFDVAGGTFRDKISKDYKATRVKADQELYDQIPLCYEIAKAFDIPIYIKKGFEADDVIGTLTAKCHSRPLRQSYSEASESGNPEIVIVTGDMDTLQLVDEKIKVYALRKGLTDTVLYDKEEVKKKYGFGPEHVVDYKALRGDASDNIPGVPGIGEKTATELIQKIGGVNEIYKYVETKHAASHKKFSDSVIKKLETGKESAKMSKELAMIDKNVPDLNFKLGDCAVKEFNTEKISELLKKFEFFSLLKRIPGIKNPPTPPFSKGGKDKQVPPLTKGGRGDIGQSPLERGGRRPGCVIIEINKNNLAEFIKEIEKTDFFACKEILSGNNILDSELLGLVFATEKNSYYLPKQFVIPTEVEGSLLPCARDSSTPLRSARNDTWDIFQNKTKTLVGHDLKQLNKVFLNLQSEIKNLQFDVMIASYIINSSTRSHDLKSIVMRELGKDLPASSDQSSLFGSDKEKIAEELQYCLELYPKMKKQLEKIDDQGMFEKIEMALIPVLAEMELNGIAVDTDALKELSHDVNKAIEKVTKKIWKEADEEFNIASPLQLREILFEKLKIPTDNIKKGKTGLSTAESELEKLLEEHPIIPLILEHRELAKLQNTYVDVLPTLINKKTGRIHTTFNQAVTTTGRLSSSDPNLQNIPIRTDLGKEVRNAFVAEKGHSLIVADYSQIELRIVASLARDEKMIEIFKNNEDIHKATAAAINNVKLEEVTKEMRYAAKEVNFGVLYGMGAHGLSWRAGIPQWQAKEFIEKYFEKFAGVKKYIDQTLKFAKQEGYVETLFGRRRYIPELKAENFQLRSAGERMAINMPIQGTAADLMKLAMIEVHKNLKNVIARSKATKQSQGDCFASLAMTDAKIILQVHDELVLEVKNGLEDEVSKIVKQAMENVVKLRVPVEVHVDVGKRWGELK